MQRLDKFLKTSRVVKRRTLAKEICDRSQVMVNGRVAKAGAIVKEGDILTVNFGRRVLKLEIISIKENVAAGSARELYRVIEDRYI